MWHYINILIGFLAIAGIVVMIVKHPIAPKISRWLMAHRSLVDLVAPFVFVLWGGVIWVALILKRDFTIVIPMIAASVLIGTGIFFFFKRF